MDKIDFSSNIPIYIQLRNLIKEQIISKAILPGEKLPSEAALQEKYGISRTPIRQAIAYLVSSGYLVSKAGKGTFVRSNISNIIEESLTRLTSFHEDMAERGINVTEKILEFKEIKADENLKTMLNLGTDERVIQIKRLFYAGNDSLSIQYSHIPKLFIKDFPFQEKLNEYKSIYFILEKVLGYVIEDAMQNIESCVAEKEISKLLNIKNGEPLLKHKRITYIKTGDPIEYVLAYFKASKYKYFIRLKR